MQTEHGQRMEGRGSDVGAAEAGRGLMRDTRGQKSEVRVRHSRG